uniref:Uncharacterized protein n=1 Tax=Brassica oleracea var. oleracea TaxID=109376 RepID=A0A0D3CQ83_BRAOL
MADELDHRLDAAVYEAFDEYFEDTYNSIAENRTNKQKKHAYVERNREASHNRLWNDFFSENPSFPENLFRSRFRMKNYLEMNIYEDPLQRIFNVYSILERCAASWDDWKHQLYVLGVEKLPNRLERTYTRGSGKPTLVLEAVASQDLWIWHAYFGSPDTLNDINVLDRSPVFDDIYQGRAPRVTYMVNGHQYDLAYYLTDDIYPKWSTFIQSITLPQGPKAELFAKV